MSSILDAVTKDASRSGTIPGETGPSAPSGRSGSGGGPGRFRAAALVVVFGVAMGALAARMFGGGEGEQDDMLTEKSTGRSAVAASQGAPGEEPATARPRKKDLAGAKPAAQSATKDKPAVVAAAPAVPPAPAPLVIPAPAPAAAPPLPVSPPPAVAVPPAAVAKAPPAPVASPPAVVAAAPAAPALPPKAPSSPPAAPLVTPPVAAVTPPAAVVVPPAAVTPPVVAVAPPVVAVAAKPAAPALPSPVAPPAAKAPPVVVAGASPPTTLVPGENLAAPEDAGEGDAPVAAPAASEVVLEEKPDGAPEVSILFVAWSKKPANRMASMRIGSGALSVVREGEYVEGLQVTGIHPESVVFRWTAQKFRVPVRPF